ncbi:hypothetical protein GGQ08_001651 [Salinibacter ruber]|nr:hypothetical protein [Salinibacter ruber]MCS3653611.1 hypothetical protein [Salinibacter ruber]
MLRATQQQNPHDECPVQGWGPRCTGGTLAF